MVLQPQQDQWLVLAGIVVALILFTGMLQVDADVGRRPQGKIRALEAAYRRFSPSAAPPARNPRRRLILLVLVALVLATVAWLALLPSRGLDERAVQSSSAESATPDRASLSAAAASAPRRAPAASDEAIQLGDVAGSAKPFEAVRIQGIYRGGAQTFLRVQRWEEDEWLTLPVPVKTDKSGKFTTYVEIGQPGRHRLRILDPHSGMTSKPFVLMIKG